MRVFDHLDPTAFSNGIKATHDWDIFLSKFRKAQEAELAPGTHFLHSLESTSRLNAKFILEGHNGYTWVTDHNSNGQVALFSVVGFVTNCSLTVEGYQRPVMSTIDSSLTANIRLSTNLGPRRSMQSITITGLDDSIFQDAVKSVDLISDFMLEAGGNITALPASVALGGHYRAITASTRLMTPAEHNVFSVVDIPTRLDVNGYMNRWARDVFVYTTDMRLKW
ncbi:hypothetical protein B0H14DRAFT_2576253 [Mycena olivaceomarginata]|nr:hypothetical protein B0H14DRAFT_2576253 [Mycena olivaceomarginata]